MKRNHFSIASLVIGAVFLLVLTGCWDPVKITGGGWLESAVEGKANFGVVFNGCKDDATLNFTYHDKAAGVKLKGGLYEIIDEDTLKVEYRSTNPKDRGEGLAILTLVDNGEGTGEHGDLSIEIYSGPFAGYKNIGLINGNIQEHECNEDEDW